MKKTTLYPKDAAELESWIEKLKEAEVPYDKVRIGKTYVLELDETHATEILGVQPRKLSKGMKITLIVLGSLVALMIVAIIGGNSMLAEDANTPFVDYRDLLGKSKAQLIEQFGEPKNEEPSTTLCPGNECLFIEFENGLAVTLHDDVLKTFSFTTNAFDENDYLIKIGLDTDQQPDGNNYGITQWMEIEGLQVLVTNMDSNEGGSVFYSVTVLDVEQRAKAIHNQQVLALFDQTLGGQIPAVMNSIMNSMHDAYSYEHVKTAYEDRGNHVYVECTFRGKNVLGAKVLSKALATVDLGGNVLEIKLAE